MQLYSISRICTIHAHSHTIVDLQTQYSARATENMCVSMLLNCYSHSYAELRHCERTSMRNILYDMARVYKRICAVDSFGNVRSIRRQRIGWVLAACSFARIYIYTICNVRFVYTLLVPNSCGYGEITDYQIEPFTRNNFVIYLCLFAQHTTTKYICIAARFLLHAHIVRPHCYKYLKM